MLNVGNSTVCPSLNDSAAKFSQFKYSTLTKPGVEASFWTLAVLAAFLNVLVIVARCRSARHRTSPLSMLLINLATSDFLLATGKILYLITARIVASWCSETTVMSKSLCFAAYLLSNMSCSMTTLTSATIASFGFKEIVGCCCCSSGRNSKRQVLVILTFTWLISIAYAAAMIKNDGSHLTSIEINGSSFIDWHICWVYDMAPAHNATAAHRDIATICAYFVFVFGITALYSTIVSVVYCTSKAKDTQFRSRLGWTLMTTVFISVPLVSVQIIWNLLLISNADDLGKFLKHKFATYLGIVADFSLLSVALLNTLLFTILTVTCWHNLFGLRCRSCFRRRDLRFEATSLVDETSSVFPDTSNSTLYSCEIDNSRYLARLGDERTPVFANRSYCSSINSYDSSVNVRVGSME